MIGFAVSFLGLLGATLVPAFFGLLAVVLLFRRCAPRYAAAFAAGVFLWYFSDTIGGSSYLGVNRGFSGGFDQVVLIVLFVAGVSLCLTDRYGFVAGEGMGREVSSRSYIIIPSIVALALSVHGFSEGADFGALASSTTGTSLIAVLGGYGPAISYALHKMLEASMIGASYLYSSSFRNQVPGWTNCLRDISILGAVFTIPSLLGVSTGYYLPLNSTYPFALASGTSVYVALRLAQPLVTSGGRNSFSESIRLTLLIMSGFLSIYFAALFHSTSLG